MKNFIRINIILLSLILTLLSGCRSGKPDMAYEQEDGGAIQQIDAFDVTATAENFRETSDEFTEKVKIID